MDFLRQFIDGLRQAWRQLSLTARVNIALAGVAVAVVIGSVVYFGAQPQYVSLASDIESNNLAKMTDLLKGAGIAYRLENNNTTIVVPVKNRSEAQLLLTENNIPIGRKALPGFELFAETDLMTNQWLHDVKFMRALQGELQRQLNAFDFVKTSYVLIREAKDELFTADQKPSEAAVTLELVRPISKQEIKAVVSVIDHAGGPNLHTGNITVTTTQGEALYLPPETEYAALANNKLEYVVELEHQREAKLREKLREMGVKGTVSVSAQVDFDQKEINDEAIKEGATLSSYTTETKSASGETTPEGTPGATANIPDGNTATGTSTNEQTTEEITNFEPSRTVTKTKSDPGDVIKYLVTMIVEGDYEETTDANGAKNRTYKGLDDKKTTLYTDLARATVGDGRTQTEVKLHDQPFAIAGLEAAAAAEQADQVKQVTTIVGSWGWTAAQLALIMAGFFVIRRALRRAVYKAEEIVEEEAEIELPEATREDLRRQEVETELSRLSSDHPDLVAALIRTWLAEEEN